MYIHKQDLDLSHAKLSNLIIMHFLITDKQRQCYNDFIIATYDSYTFLPTYIVCVISSCTLAISL